MARDRPADSLLEQDLDFDFRGKVPEPITEEVTKQLEDIIKQRIVDGAWDDVERKVELKEKTFTPNDEVSSEKSKIGLAEVYEKQLLEETKKAMGQLTSSEEKVNKEHEEIAIAMAKLFHKLDALSNFHFTPKPPTQEITVNKNVPALQLEEKIPSAENVEGTRAAPQEIYESKDSGAPTSRSELTQQERRSKRAAKRNRRKKMKLSKEQEKLDQKRAQQRQLGVELKLTEGMEENKEDKNKKYEKKRKKKK